MLLLLPVIRQPQQEQQPQGDDQVHVVPLHQQEQDDQDQQDIPAVQLLQPEDFQDAVDPPPCPRRTGRSAGSSPLRAGPPGRQSLWDPGQAGGLLLRARPGPPRVEVLRSPGARSPPAPPAPARADGAPDAGPPPPGRPAPPPGYKYHSGGYSGYTSPRPPSPMPRKRTRITRASREICTARSSLARRLSFRKGRRALSRATVRSSSP